ncbi:hypothetical protein ACO0K0_06755 [Undibacterium sp. SXout11W]|uniref:hypothetical protein n=1 Tax=Undibacterium sp. SXout11W TaxID=3413050 RepID=UPI003BF0D734
MCHNAQSFNFSPQAGFPRLEPRRIGISHVISINSPYKVANQIPVNMAIKQISAMPSTVVPPSGSKIACMTDNTSSTLSKTCPVVQSNGINYWPFSYVDNREAINLVGYDVHNNVVSQLELTGTRYIWQVALSNDAKTLIFKGQASTSTSLAVATLGK